MTNYNSKDFSLLTEAEENEYKESLLSGRDKAVLNFAAMLNNIEDEEEEEEKEKFSSNKYVLSFEEGGSLEQEIENVDIENKEKKTDSEKENELETKLDETDETPIVSENIESIDLQEAGKEADVDTEENAKE